MTRRFELSGHRGARGLWPENTLAGFAGALRLGVDALEFDVVLSADGVPVVTHDLTLNPDLARAPGGRWIDAPGPSVASLTVADLQRLDVGRLRPGSALARAFPHQAAVDGQAIPTLDAVLRLVGGHAVRLDVELKADPARLAGPVLEAAAAAKVADRVTLRAFDWPALLRSAALTPTMTVCFLTETSDAETLAAIDDAAAGREAEWAPAFEALTPAMVAAAQRLGLRVKPWTVNRAQDMARLIAWGVDGFCTDLPDVARRAMAQAGLPLPPPLAVA